MWHCLYAYRIVGDNAYGLGKLVPYGSIFILYFFFSCTFLVVCVLMERVSHLGRKSSFSGIKVSTQLSVLTFILKQLSSIWSYLDKVSSKSCKNVNCVMITVNANCVMITVNANCVTFGKQMNEWMLLIKD